MKYKDYYATLGVPRDANTEAIKKAYRKLARLHHPDVSQDAGAETRFKDAAEAYATLKDPDKRAAYDELGLHRPGEDMRPPPQWRQAFAEADPGFQDVDLSDLLDALSRQRHGTHRAPVRGRDYEAFARIGLVDAHRGCTIDLDVQQEAGVRTLQVTIPPGVQDGQRMRLRGRGGKGRNGGADGDIYLHVSLSPHPTFRADGHDLYFDLALAPWEGALGASIEVPTLDGPVLLAVPAGTGAGKKLRLRDRGLANSRGGRGDLYAVVRIDVPATLTDRERELFEQLAGASTFSPRAPLTRESKHERSTA